MLPLRRRHPPRPARPHGDRSQRDRCAERRPDVRRRNRIDLEGGQPPLGRDVVPTLLAGGRARQEVGREPVRSITVNVSDEAESAEVHRVQGRRRRVGRSSGRPSARGRPGKSMLRRIRLPARNTCPMRKDLHRDLGDARVEGRRLGVREGGLRPGSIGRVDSAHRGPLHPGGDEHLLAVGANLGEDEAQIGVGRRGADPDATRPPGRERRRRRERRGDEGDAVAGGHRGPLSDASRCPRPR